MKKFLSSIKEEAKALNPVNIVVFVVITALYFVAGFSASHFAEQRGFFELTEEEFSEIKKHTIWGWEILSNIVHSPTLCIGARFHHEKYDGSGYPEGLAGDDIPEFARIIAVADAYDAMTSKRSYRNTMEQAQVRGEIENGMGSQFDPDFAKIMLSMIDEDTDYKMRENAEALS